MSRTFQLWDIPTRVFHWSLVVLVTVMIVTGEAELLKIHMLVGPAVLALIFFRILWGFAGSTTSRFCFFVKGPKEVQAYIHTVKAGQKWHGIGHNPVGALSVLALLAIPTVLVLTGLFSSNNHEIFAPLAPLISKPMVKDVTEIHELFGSLILIFVGLHVAAILFYRFVKGEDLIWPMITGVKEQDQDTVPALDFKHWSLALFLMVVSAVSVWGCLALVTPALQ